jgi:hypothetical protein
MGILIVSSYCVHHVLAVPNFGFCEILSFRFSLSCDVVHVVMYFIFQLLRRHRRINVNLGNLGHEEV